jgi:hypothetical protein
MSSYAPTKLKESKMQIIDFDKKLKEVEKAYPNWALGNVYRFDKASNILTFEQWIEKLYKDLHKNR